MPRLHLVRHGQAAAGWGHHPDPGLDALGARQARDVAERLADAVDPAAIVTSPMRRAVETARPLVELWEQPAVVVPAFGEIPSPTGLPGEERRAWLSSALASRWGHLDDQVAAWRADLLAAARSVQEDTVAFTHFVAINAIVAEATADDAVTVFLPATTSVTEVEVDPGWGRLRVVALGSESAPEVG